MLCACTAPLSLATTNKARTFLVLQIRSSLHAIAIFACFIVAIALTAHIYWPGLDGPLLLDDGPNIFTYTDMPRLDIQSLTYVATHNNSGMLGRPIPSMSFGLTRFIHGDGSYWFKYENLMLHLICGSLLFWLALRLASSPKANLSQKQGVGIALVTTSIWLLHPLFVSTVLYSVQRIAILSTLFSLCAMLSYVIIRQNLNRRPLIGLIALVILYLVFVPLSVLSKETGALIPPLILSIELFLFGFKTESHREKIALFTFIASFVLIPILGGVFYFTTHLDSLLSGYAGRDFSLTERLLSECNAMLLYLKQLLLPRLSDMTLLHDDFPIQRTWDLGTVASLCTLILLVSITPFIYRRSPLAGLGIAWFFVGHTLESTVLPLELVFEHRNYLPGYGILLAATSLSMKVFAAHTPYLAYIAPLCILSFLGTLTSTRVYEWSSYNSWLQAAIIDHPNSPRARNNLADYYVRHGRIDKALAEVEVIKKLLPDDSAPWLHQFLLTCGGKDIPPDAIEEASIRLASKPFTMYGFKMIDRLGNVVLTRECPAVPANVLKKLTAHLIGNPRTASDPSVLNIALWSHAKALMVLDDYPGAVEYSLKAYNAFPSSLNPLVTLAYWQTSKNKFAAADETIAMLKRANESPLIEEGAEIEKLIKFRNTFERNRAPAPN